MQESPGSLLATVSACCRSVQAVGGGLSGAHSDLEGVVRVENKQMLKLGDCRRALKFGSSDGGSAPGARSLVIPLL